MSLKKFSRLLTIFLVGSFFVATLLVLGRNDGQTILQSRNVYATDGDSVRIKGQAVRLWGIDAPELDQTCTTPEGEDWPCGRVSRDRLAEKLANSLLECKGSRFDKYNRLLAICTIGGVDVGSQMVREGMAVSYGAYRPEETMARADRSGLWSGTFVRPRDWRDAQPDRAVPEGFLGWLFR
ncbi:MAG TPA: thermonuclease family protein [Devosia sp.]|nr:thermonuclease family protein [Devosia sp.]